MAWQPSPLFHLYPALDHLRCLFWALLKHIWFLDLWFRTEGVKGPGMTLRWSPRKTGSISLSTWDLSEPLTADDSATLKTSTHWFGTAVKLLLLILWGCFSSNYCGHFKERHKHMLNFYTKHLLKYNIEALVLSWENNHFHTHQEQNEGFGWKRLYCDSC